MEDRNANGDSCGIRRSHKVTEDRKARRVHPYSRPESSQKRKGKDYPTFDLAIKCKIKRSSHSKTSSVVETSPSTSSSANVLKSDLSFESENGNISPAVVSKKHQQNAGTAFELHDKCGLISSEARVQGTLSDNGMEKGEIGNDPGDLYLGKLQESDLVSYFSDFDSTNDCDQNSINSPNVEVFPTTHDLAAPVGVVVKQVPSQHLVVITDAEFTTNDVQEFMPMQPKDPHFSHEGNGSFAPKTIPTVSSELMRSACSDHLANCVLTPGFAQMPKCDMDNGYDSCPEKVLNKTCDQVGILLPSDSNFCVCETTEGILSQPTTLTTQPPEAQLNVLQVDVQPEHWNYPGTPLSSCSSVNNDLKEDCPSRGDAAVSSDCSSLSYLLDEETHLDDCTPEVENVTSRDGLADPETQLTVLKQLISKVLHLQTQINQNAKSSSLLKAIKYIKDRSNNFTTLSWFVKGKVSSVKSDCKRQYEKLGTLVQEKDESNHDDDSVATQSNLARMAGRNKDSIHPQRQEGNQPLQPKKGGQLKLAVARSEEQDRKQRKIGNRRKELSVRVEKYLHPHHKERNQRSNRITQDPTSIDFHANDSDNGSSRPKAPDISEQLFIVREKSSQEVPCGSSVTCDDSSHQMSRVMAKPDSLVTTNTGVMLEPTEVVKRITNHSLLEIVSLQDCSITTSREMLHEAATMREMLHEPTTSREMLHEPTTSREMLHEPTTSREMLHESKHEPKTSREILHEPTTSREMLHEPTTSREMLHEPTTSREMLHEPTTKREMLHESKNKREMLNEPTKETSGKCYQSQLAMKSHEVSPTVTANSELLKSAEQNKGILHEPASVTVHDILQSFPEIISSEISLEPFPENTAINIKDMSNEMTCGEVSHALPQGAVSEELHKHLETAISKIVIPDEVAISKMPDGDFDNLCTNSSTVGLMSYCEVSLDRNSQPELNKATVINSDRTNQGYKRDTEYYECKKTPLKDIADQVTGNLSSETDQLQMSAHFPQSDVNNQPTSQNCCGNQISEDLKLATENVSCKSLMSNSTNDTVTKALTAGEHVGEFEKGHTLRSLDVKHTHPNASNLVTCHQQQPVCVPREVIGAKLSRIRTQMEHAVQNEIFQIRNPSLPEPRKNCTMCSVKCLCSRSISHAKNTFYKDYSQVASKPNSSGVYEGACTQSTAALSGHALSSHERSQPYRKIPKHVYEMTHFQPTQCSETLSKTCRNQCVSDCLKPTELSEDLLHPALHQSQKQPAITRCCLETSHPPPSSAQLRAYKLPLQRQFTHWHAGVSPCSQSGHCHSQTQCESGNILQDSYRSHVMSYSHTYCSCTKGISRKRHHSVSLGSSNKRLCSNPNENQTHSGKLHELSHNEVEETKDCLHGSHSSPQHTQNLRLHSTSEEHMLKAEVLLGCLIKEISHDVRPSPQDTVSRQHYSPTETRHNYCSLEESSCYKSHAREYAHDGNHPIREIKVRSYSRHRKHARKAKAAVDSPDVAGHDDRWSPLKVNKKHHAKSRKTRSDASHMLKSSGDEDNINQRYSYPRKINNVSSYSRHREHVRKAKAAVDSSDVSDHDARWSPLKVNKKHAKSRKTHGSATYMLNSSHDEENINQTCYSSPKTRKSFKTHSANNYTKEAKAGLNYFVEDTHHGDTWSPLKVDKKWHHRKKSKHQSVNPHRAQRHIRQRKSKHSSSDIVKSTHDTDSTVHDHYHDADNCSLQASESIRSDSAYREHLRKAKALLDFDVRQSSHDIRWTPVRKSSTLKRTSKVTLLKSDSHDIEKPAQRSMWADVIESQKNAP